MAFKDHRITNYTYSLDGRTGMAGGAQLFSADGKQRLVVRVAADNASMPAPTLAPDLETGTCSLLASAIPVLIDMLRNEDPVSVTLNNQSPGFVFIKTSIEFVGVADEHGPMIG
jgi:hypothetical protein